MLGSILKGNEICPRVPREASSVVDSRLDCDPMDEGDFPAVPKTDRRSGTDGCDFLNLPRGTLRAG